MILLEWELRMKQSSCPPAPKVKSLDITKSLQEIHGGSRNMLNTIIKMQTAALAGVAQWIECWPVNQRVDS